MKEFSERVIDSIGDALLVIDPNDYTIISANEAALKQLKLRKEDLIGKTCYETTHHRSTPCKPPHDVCPIQEMLKTGKAVTVEHTHFDKDNNEIYVEVSANPVRNHEGKIVQVVHLARNITERKKIEEALVESEEKYRGLFESANDALVYGDLTERILDVNRKAEELAGIKKEEILGKPFWKLGLVSQKDVPKLLSQLARRVDGKPMTGFELTITKKDGEKRFIEVNTAIIRTSKVPTGFLAVVRDITERKKMERKLQEYAEHLEEMVEQRTRELREAQEELLKSERLAAIGELATMVGHDLRNPLQSIENATYYLNNELPRLSRSTPIPQKTMEMLQVINDSVNYADKIIKDLRDFSATKKFILKKTDINAIVKETLSQVEASENVELITELGHLPEIKADKDQIKRVFLNLAENAIQAMENGGRLKVSTKKTKEFIEVSFEDTGIGVSKENMKKLFTPFFTTKARGLGMGLAICKRFVESHGAALR